MGLGRDKAKAAILTPQVVAPFFGGGGGEGGAAGAAGSYLSATAVAAGGHHSGAIDSKGTVYTWGHGLWHQLGHGSGGAAAEGGRPENACEPRAVDALARAGGATRLALGHAHSLAVVGHAGILASWGSDENGSLGQGVLWPRAYSPLPHPVLEAGSDDGRGGPSLSAGASAAASAAGGFFSSLVSRVRRRTTGGGGASPAPPPPPQSSGPPPPSSPPPPLRGVLQAAAGWKHSAAVGAAGELWTWGWGGAPGAGGFVSGAGADLGGGQLGIGDPGEDRMAPARVQRLELPGGGGGGGSGSGSGRAALDLRAGGAWRARQVSCGRNHTAAVVEVDAGAVD